MGKESLAVKYRPKTFDDVVEQRAIKDILVEQINTNTFKHAYLFCGPAGCGKAQPLGSLVLTPHGYIRMGDIKVGDEVFTHQGNVANVVGIYPQGSRRIYRITLQDKTSIEVSDEHLNCVYRYNQYTKKREDYIITTNELLEFFETSRFRLRIDIPKVDWPELEVPVDPYLIGALIGDGSLTHGNLGFSNSEEDVVEKVDSILFRDFGLGLRKVKGDNVDYNIIQVKDSCTPIKEFKNILESMGLRVKSIEKHIPEGYLHNSYSNRLKLLQGLFDTDGSINSRVPTFYTSSPKLSEDFAYLVRSMGIRDTVCESPSGYTNDSGEYIKCHDSYSHILKIDNGVEFFTSNKHKSRYGDRQNPPMRNIEKIEYIGEKECQCIYVDHPDHTYISDGFIPTHNTTAARIFANDINKGQGNAIEVDAASNNGVDNIREIIDNAQRKPLDSEYKVYILDEAHMLSVGAFNALLKLLEEPPKTTVFIMCTTDPQKVPATILSRVQRYDFSKISLDNIKNRLLYILEQEYPNGECSFEVAAIDYISKMSEGGMRDAITMLDKCLSLSSDLTVESVVTALGTVDYVTHFDLLFNLYTGCTESAISIIEQVYNSGKDLKQFLKQFQYFVVDVCKYQVFKDFKYISIPELSEYKQRLEDEDIDLDLDVLDWIMKLNSEIKWESNPKAIVETSILLYSRKGA